jgi:hypothetical protein
MNKGNLDFKINCDATEAKKEVEVLIVKLKSVKRLTNPKLYFWLGLSIGANVILLLDWLFSLLYS